MKKLSYIVIAGLIVSLQAGVYAEETGTGSQVRAMKIEAQSEIKENRMEASENRKDFREENKDIIEEIRSSLSDEEIETVENLREDLQAELEVLKEEIQTSDSVEEKTELKMEIDDLMESYHAEIREAVSENEAALELIDARKEVYETNEALRDENKEIRTNYRADRKEHIAKYKKAFVKRIGNALDTLSEEKLIEISERITMFVEKTEANEKLSDEKKEAVLDQLDALQEIIAEQLDSM